MYFCDVQEQETGEDKEAMVRLTGLADQLVATGDYSILFMFSKKKKGVVCVCVSVCVVVYVRE